MEAPTATTAPPPPVKITASAGDTLCHLAVANGFRDCAPLRALPENADFLNRPLRSGDQVTIPTRSEGTDSGPTETRHRFVRPGIPVASIRFVHGSLSLPYEDDPTITELNVSNYVTNRAGNNGEGNANFVGPTHRKFDQNAHEDEDTFKVEVHDLRTRKSDLDVVVEALKPTYNAAGGLNGHEDFAGSATDPATERGRRCLNIKAGKQGATNRFRSAYLRLVVDDVDNTAAPHDAQMLLTTDMVDAAAAADPTGNSADAVAMRRVEILDQDIRASYVLDKCPAASPQAKCSISTTATIGRGLSVDLAVRVLRATATGVVESAINGPGDDGIVKLADIRRRIEMFCRRVWAQSHVKCKITRLETVDLPSDMITVGDINPNPSSGVSAAGGGQGEIGFTIDVQRFGRSPDSTHVVVAFQVPAGNTPEDTANLIASHVNALPGVRARVSVNPAEVFNSILNPDGTTTDRQSADVLFTDLVSGGRITITNLTGIPNQDSAQIVEISSLTPDLSIRNGNDDYHVGHPEERALYKPLDTGDQVIDLYVLRSFSGRPNLLGFTVPECKEMNGNRRLMSGMMNTIVMRRDSADGTSNQPFALPHEIGHVLLDNSLHADSNHQLMFATAINNGNVQDPKRLIGRTPPANNWDHDLQNPNGSVGSQRVKLNAVDRVRTTSAHLLH